MANTNTNILDPIYFLPIWIKIYTGYQKWSILNTNWKFRTDIHEYKYKYKYFSQTKPKVNYVHVYIILLSSCICYNTMQNYANMYKYYIFWDNKRGQIQIWIFGLVFANANTNTNTCHTLAYRLSGNLHILFRKVHVCLFWIISVMVWICVLCHHISIMFQVCWLYCYLAISDTLHCHYHNISRRTSQLCVSPICFTQAHWAWVWPQHLCWHLGCLDSSEQWWEWVDCKEKVTLVLFDIY